MHACVSSSDRPVIWAISSSLGWPPRLWLRSRLTLRTLLIFSIMWTGTRMVRLWSAIARLIAWRIHQVA